MDPAASTNFEGNAATKYYCEGKIILTYILILIGLIKTGLIINGFSFIIRSVHSNEEVVHDPMLITAFFKIIREAYCNIR